MEGKDNGMVQPIGQTVINAGSGAKSNDSFESLRVSGDAGAAALPKLEKCCEEQNTAYGQKVV